MSCVFSRVVGPVAVKPCRMLPYASCDDRNKNPRGLEKLLLIRKHPIPLGPVTVSLPDPKLFSGSVNLGMNTTRQLKPSTQENAKHVSVGRPCLSMYLCSDRLIS